MKDCAAALIILVLLSATCVRAEDFKTVSGKVYRDATISRVESDGIVLRTKTGISKVYFVELPKDIQEKFHYRQATPIPAQRAREPGKLESTPNAAPRAGGGGKVVIVGQHSGRPQGDAGGWAGVLPVSGVFLKLFALGALTITGIMLFIVRKRREKQQPEAPRDDHR